MREYKSVRVKDFHANKENNSLEKKVDRIIDLLESRGPSTSLGVRVVNEDVNTSYKPIRVNQT